MRRGTDPWSVPPSNCEPRSRSQGSSCSRRRVGLAARQPLNPRTRTRFAGLDVSRWLCPDEHKIQPPRQPEGSAEQAARKDMDKETPLPGSARPSRSACRAGARRTTADSSWIDMLARLGTRQSIRGSPKPKAAAGPAGSVVVRALQRYAKLNPPPRVARRGARDGPHDTHSHLLFRAPGKARPSRAALYVRAIKSRSPALDVSSALDISPSRLESQESIGHPEACTDAYSHSPRRTGASSRNCSTSRP